MDIQVTARHFHVHDSIRSHAISSVESLAKYYDGIVNAEVILSFDPPHTHTKIAEITVSVWGQTLVAKEGAVEFPIAIDAAVEKIERQLKKYKEKLHDHHEEHKLKDITPTAV